MKNAWVFSAACGLLAAGCAAMYPHAETTSKRLDCDAGGSCVVAVSVACTHFYGCRLSVDSDLILVKGRGKPTTITWTLSGDPGANFPADGIALDSGEFDCSRKPEGKEISCVDRHSGFGIFKYRVNVTVPNSAFGPRGVPSLDPWIIND